MILEEKLVLLFGKMILDFRGKKWFFFKGKMIFALELRSKIGSLSLKNEFELLISLWQMYFGTFP